MGLRRQRNYAGRWDVLIQQATQCLNRLIQIAARKKRNYILDQVLPGDHQPPGEGMGLLGTWEVLWFFFFPHNALGLQYWSEVSYTWWHSPRLLTQLSESSLLGRRGTAIQTWLKPAAAQKNVR